MSDPYLHIRMVDGLLGDALAITGNRAGLLQLRAQVDRALADEDSYPFEEAIYRDALGEDYEVLVKRAKSRGELEERARLPKQNKTAEELPWAEKSRKGRRWES